MKRLLTLTIVAVLSLLGFVGAKGSAQGKAPGPSGRILFQRLILDLQEHKVEIFKRYTYTANPDGSDVRPLTPSQLCAADLPRDKCTAEAAQWSPDGSEVLVQADVCGVLNCAAFIVNPDTGASRTLSETDPTRPVHCMTWSPDGSRLACVLDPSDSGLDPNLAGIYTIRSSDGGDLRRVTDFLSFPADYSPDGNWIVFQSFDDDGVGHLSVVRLDGSGLKQITPPAFQVNPGVGVSWSPAGTKILFSGVFADTDRRGALWTVRPDGSGMHKVPIPRCGGLKEDPTSLGCLRPAWSPEGTKIVFDARGSKSRQIYTANVDGSGLTQATSGGLDNMDADWGTHPLAT